MSWRIYAAIAYMTLWAMFLGVMFGGVLAGEWTVQFVGIIGVVVLGFGGIAYLWWDVRSNPPPPLPPQVDAWLDGSDGPPADSRMWDGGRDDLDGGRHV